MSRHCHEVQHVYAYCYDPFGFPKAQMHVNEVWQWTRKGCVFVSLPLLQGRGGMLTQSSCRARDNFRLIGELPHLMSL